MLHVDELASELEAALFPRQAVTVVDPGSVVAWAEDRFYIIETKRPIVLQPVQRAVLEIMTERAENGRFRWKTLLYSTIKKSGKTSIAALYQRWAAEMWGDYGEIYHMGNKLDQAKERAFKITRHSIELGPKHERAEWDMQALTLTHLPTRSFIRALPMSASGEAGGNQRLTTWTELWGYQYASDEEMFTEMQPVPTQLLSQRFVESYAGYKGRSMLLWKLWQLGLEGERLHDEYPIFGNAAAGLCAYIDQGEAARRMLWQLGAEGAQYYAEQRLTETPGEYERLHENRWVDSQAALIPIAVWDRLQAEIRPPATTDIVVVGADAGVSSDGTALVVVKVVFEDAPTLADVPEDDLPYPLDQPGVQVHVLDTLVWTPEEGALIDYDDTIKPALEGMLRRYPVTCVAYDEYQLHDMMTGFAKRWSRTAFQAFKQGADRVRADTMLVRRIKQGKLRHDGNAVLRQHIDNADGKTDIGEKRLRIVKRDPLKKIDAAVALSMAVQVAVEVAQMPRGMGYG